MRDVWIETEPVELHKILKFAGLVNSGGEAKSVIADGQVRVDGVVETRKRRKIVAGNVIDFGADTLHVRFGTGAPDP